MDANAQNTGSDGVRDWKHTPNLTPKGYEIKKDELYVLNGETIIHAYHLLMSQRLSALQILAKIPPTNITQYEEYMSLLKHINSTLNFIVKGIPLPQILAMQEQARVERDAEIKRAEGSDEGINIAPLKKMIDKFGISLGGKDENEKNTPPENPSENDTEKE